MREEYPWPASEVRAERRRGRGRACPSIAASRSARLDRPPSDVRADDRRVRCRGVRRKRACPVRLHDGLANGNRRPAGTLQAGVAGAQCCGAFAVLAAGLYAFHADTRAPAVQFGEGVRQASQAGIAITVLGARHVRKPRACGRTRDERPENEKPRAQEISHLDGHSIATRERKRRRRPRLTTTSRPMLVRKASSASHDDDGKRLACGQTIVPAPLLACSRRTRGPGARRVISKVLRLPRTACATREPTRADSEIGEACMRKAPVRGTATATFRAHPLVRDP